MLTGLTRSTLFPYTTLFRSRVSIGAFHVQWRRRVHPGCRVWREHRLQPHLRDTSRYSFLCEFFRGDSRNRRCARSEEHTSELQSRRDLVCRLLLEKKNEKSK